MYVYARLSATLIAVDVNFQLPVITKLTLTLATGCLRLLLEMLYVVYKCLNT